MINRGLEFDLKLLDMYYHGAPTSARMQEDVVDIVGILYEVVGGKCHYRNEPDIIKSICKGLKHSLIKKEFKNAIELQSYLEQITW